VEGLVPSSGPEVTTLNRGIEAQWTTDPG